MKFIAHQFRTLLFAIGLGVLFLAMYIRAVWGFWMDSLDVEFDREAGLIALSHKSTEEDQ